MLFDLRSRGRRRTVQVIYVVLALVMLSGLLLVGVGTGSGGGILNAFTNNGSGNNQSSVVAKDLRNAQRQAKLHPTSPAAWQGVVRAAYQKSINTPDIDAKTGAFTPQSRKDMKTAAYAWDRYQALTKTPDDGTAELAAKVLGVLNNFSGQAAAWEIFADANPTAALGFECLAVSAYAANQTRKGDLASQQALQVTPKAQQFEFKKQTLPALKSNAKALAENPQQC